MGGFLGVRSGQWAVGSCSTEYPTCFDRHVCSSSCGSVFWATDHLRALFTAKVATSEAVVVICVLVVAQVVVLELCESRVAAIVGSDAVAEQQCSGCENRGLG